MGERHQRHESNHELPAIPDDLTELIEDTHDREHQRRKALEVALREAAAAKSDEVRQVWVLRAMEFGDILEEYTAMYPELFPDEKQS